MAQRRIRQSSRREEPESRSEYWRGQSNAWLRSGQTQGDFCEEQDLSLSAFRWWRWKLKKEESRPDGFEVEVADQRRGMRFVPVRVVDPESPRPSSAAGDSPRTFEVILNGGTRVRVPRDFDSEALSRLLHTLEAMRC